MAKGRAFLLGAGASRADGFPLMRDLVLGIAERIVAGHAYERLQGFLCTAFNVRPEHFAEGAEAWRELTGEGRTPRRELYYRLPDLTDVLSSIDVLLDEEGSLGRYADGGQLDASELRAVRDELARALSETFERLDRGLSERTLTDGFVARVSPDDVVLTTNWDLLLDRALDRRFGTAPADYGTAALLRDAKRPRGRRPMLLKLQGSLSWLHCRRCHRLYASPTRMIGERGGRCECTFPLDKLIITPTYLKGYDNLHLQNLWAEALRQLAARSEWIFAGYSLPHDDIHIRTLLVKAHRMRAERHDAPRVTVVTEHDDPALEARYRRLFERATFFTEGFESWIRRAGVTARGRRRASR